MKKIVILKIVTISKRSMNLKKKKQIPGKNKDKTGQKLLEASQNQRQPQVTAIQMGRPISKSSVQEAMKRVETDAISAK